MSSDHESNLMPLADWSSLDWASLKSRLPDFSEELRADPALLDNLGLAVKKRNLIDFGPAALSKLEAKALKDFDVRRQLEATARANFDAQAHAHAVTLSLMEARNHTDLARRLNDEVRNRFGLVAATIALEETGRVPMGWMPLEDGGVDYIIGEDGLSLLGPEGACRALFGDDIRRVKSAAVLRVALWREGRPGLISFGSADFDGFTPEMGVELVAFITRVVERMADRWPVLS